MRLYSVGPLAHTYPRPPTPKTTQQSTHTHTHTHASCYFCRKPAEDRLFPSGTKFAAKRQANWQPSVGRPLMRKNSKTRVPRASPACRREVERWPLVAIYWLGPQCSSSGDGPSLDLSKHQFALLKDADARARTAVKDCHAFILPGTFARANSSLPSVAPVELHWSLRPDEATMKWARTEGLAM